MTPEAEKLENNQYEDTKITKDEIKNALKQFKMA